MIANEPETEDFTNIEQVAQVGSGVVFACRTAALRIQGTFILFVDSISYCHLSLAGHGRSVSSHTSGKHAVKHVYTHLNAVQDNVGAAHSHEVARLVLGEKRLCVI